MKNRFSSLDILRGFAASIVLAFHFIGLSLPFFESEGTSPLLGSVSGFCGGLGTNILLLLSGFLIGKAESDHPGRYFHSLAKRAIRIYPLYAIIVFSGLLLGFVSPSYSKMSPQQNILESFFQQLVLIPGFFPARPVMTVSWTLSFIFAGYITLPLFARIYRLIFRDRFSLVWLWFAVMIGILAAHYYSSMGFIRMAYIPAGCLISEATLKKKIGFRGASSFWPGLFGCGFLLAARFEIYQFQNPSKLYSFLFVLSGIGAVSGMVLLLFSAEATGFATFKDALSRLLIWIGKRGYSLYLVHGTVIKLVLFGAFSLFPTKQWPILFLIPLFICCFGAALCVATLSYHVLEKYLSSWLARRFGLV